MVKFVLLLSSFHTFYYFTFQRSLHRLQSPALSLHSLIYEKTLKIMALLLIFASFFFCFMLYFSLTSLAGVAFLLILHLIMIFLFRLFAL